MSKVYYDNLLDLSKVDKTIKKVSKTHEEKMELWQIVDEIVHHRVMSCVLDCLPQNYHQEFLELFHQSPHDEKLLDYLKEKIGKDVGMIIKEVVVVLVLEIIGEVETKKAVSIAKR